MQKYYIYVIRSNRHVYTLYLDIDKTAFFPPLRLIRIPYQIDTILKRTPFRKYKNRNTYMYDYISVTVVWVGTLKHFGAGFGKSR